MTLAALVLLVAIPIGFLIAWLSRDELFIYRKWFLFISTTAFILGAIFIFIEITISLSCFFILIISILSYVKSFDKNLIKN